MADAGHSDPFAFEASIPLGGAVWVFYRAFGAFLLEPQIVAGSNVAESMPSRLEDEKHWRKRAEQMRSLAAAMPDQQQSVLMTDLAEEYDTQGM